MPRAAEDRIYPTMAVKFLKDKKVVVLLNGRYAGKKAVIVKNTRAFPFFSLGAVHLDGWTRSFRKWLPSGMGAPCPLLPLCPHLSKCLIMSSAPFEENDKASGKKFGAALVCGVDRYPLKVTKGMSAKRVERRSRIKPFVKLVNYTHVMPTRYSLDADLKEVVTTDLLKDPAKKKEARKDIKKIFEEKYACLVYAGPLMPCRHKSGQNKWFFQKLRF